MKITLYKSKLCILPFALLLALSFFSCASTKKVATEDDSAVTTEQSDSKKSKKNKKKNKKNDSDSKNEKEKQNFLGWIDTDGRPVSYENGLIKLRALPSLGSFNIAAVTPNEKVIPVLSSANEYASTSFYLQADKKIYKLTADSGIKSSAKKTETGLCLSYVIKNVADVQIDFGCFSSDEDHDTDMIKITAQITNLSTRKSKFALKAVLDTVLGESYRNHFYTTDGMPVKNEMFFSNSAEDQNMEKWIISRNSNAALQIFFRGEGVSRVEQVQLANYQTLDTQNWYPNLLSYRTFDTVRSYNNSAIGINWPASTIVSTGKSTVTFYMALALDETKPNGAKYLFPEDFVEDPIPVAEKTESRQVVMQIPEPYYEEDLVVPEQKIVEAVEADDFEVPTIKFDVATLTAEQLEPEYIQNLINRITVLEESGLAVNRAELLQLNAELDAILEILRQN